MTWISDAIFSNRASILDAVSRLLPDSGRGGPFMETEQLEQASFTLDMLIEVLQTRDITHLFSKWEAVGAACAERDVPLDDVPDLPQVLKRAVWVVMRNMVDEGDADLGEVIDAMMEVESILADCRFALVRSYLEAEDVALVARNERIEALYSLTEVLSAGGDSEDINQSVVDKVAGITGLPRCSLLLTNEEGVLEPRASNFKDALEALKGLRGASLDALAAVVDEGLSVVIDRQDLTSPGMLEFLSAYGTPTVLAAPMRSGERPLGMLLLDAAHEGQFTGVQIDLATACAGQAAVAIEKSELLGEMESRLKQMAAIGIVARSLTSHLDAKEQLESILDMATALLRADSAVFMLLEEMFEELKKEASRGDVSWSDSESFAALAQWSYDNAGLVVWHRGESDERFGELPGPVQVAMAAPLLVRDKPIGVLAIASSKNGERYTEQDSELFGNFAAQAAVSIENTRLYERLQDTYLGAIGSLAAAIEARDPYTVGHSARVTQYAVAIAESMELPAEEVEDLRLAGLLHDLGKIGVPDSILNKAGRLSDEEYSAIKMHPALSMRIIEPLPHLGNIIPIIYHHHERYDGNGYMDGKAGDKIPLGARIIAVADSFEAMTSDRPYRKALSREEAVGELSRNMGTQFDPEVVKHFLLLLETTAPAA